MASMLERGILQAGKLKPGTIRKYHSEEGEQAVNENVVALLKVLDPEDNSTGGGTASAVAGAMAGALIAMVARLSIGKQGMAPESFYQEIAAAAASLSEVLFSGGREDSLAFEAVRAAYRLEKGTDEEKMVRQQAIQAAWTNAAQVPLRNAEACAELIALAGRLLGRSNPNAASDLSCALHLARAGVLGCVANVEINIPSLKDQEVAAGLASRARELETLVTESSKTTVTNQTNSTSGVE
jgi:formiminotetrahydrofolate cyclodeaminase